jgi:hypothetical protein
MPRFARPRFRFINKGRRFGGKNQLHRASFLQADSLTGRTGFKLQEGPGKLTAELAQAQNVAL